MNNKANRVYTTVLSENVGPMGIGLGCTFQINNEGRTALLKSILFDLRIQVQGPPPYYYPIEQNTSQFFALQVLPMPLNITRFSDTFGTINNPAVMLANGATLVMYRPGQLLFNSFFIRNSLRFEWGYNNNDALITFTYFASIIVEIEDIDFKQ